MSERSELTTKTDANAFRNYYYLKEELVQFCCENGPPASGSKQELTEMIAHFLETGKVLSSSVQKKAAATVGDITESTIIEANIVCSKKHRAFFKEK